MPQEFKVKNGLIVDQGGATITGSVIATSGFTGSLQGTASYASQALSSSYAVTASYALTSSFTFTALTASNITPVITNDADTRIVTANGNGTLNGEPNMTFDGSLLNVNGTIRATVKSFIIDHPTKEGKKLQYGVLEGPEHSVYVRGRLTNTHEIILPDYWHALVYMDSMTVTVTPIGKFQELWIQDITDTVITIGSKNKKIDCFYAVFAERKDTAKLITEFDN